MISLTSLKGKAYYVVGLAKSGLATLAALKKSGVTAFGFDDAQEGGVKPEEINWATLDALVLSPGIPHTCPHPHPIAQRALEHNVPLICDVDLLAQACPQATYVGVTGTNGKSTTTALLNHILPQAQMGGNIGVPVLELDPVENQEGIYLLELSSYQLERVPSLRCDVAVLLNITPDHLDRHGDLKGYVGAKKNIFTPFGIRQYVVIGIDDPESYALYQELLKDQAKTVLPLSVGTMLEQGVSVIEGVLYDQSVKILSLTSLGNLKGAHNHQNIAAVYGVLRYFNVPLSQENLSTFPGLAHRQEWVAQCASQGRGQGDDLLFINDSKATNIQSTLRALDCYEDIHLIVGGVSKASGLQGLERYKRVIKNVYVFGQDANQLSQELLGYSISHSVFKTLEEATQTAVLQAEKGTVLLSPACASFDQYQNFEERGAAFKQIVHNLIQQKENSNV